MAPSPLIGQTLSSPLVQFLGSTSVRYHLLARSVDGGLTYQGNYGMFRPEEQWVIELTRYTAVDGSVALFANWHGGTAETKACRCSC